MANYGAELIKATSSLTVGVGSLECPGSGMRRFAIYDVSFGSDSAPADQVFRFELNRSSSAATGSAVTPAPLDVADPASVTLAKQNNTVQGTNTAGVIPLAVPLNQRATFRWVAAPGGEIIVPATANNGISFNTPVATGTPEAVISAMFQER